MPNGRSAYFSGMTSQQRDRFMKLSGEKAANATKGMLCPAEGCDGTLKLRLGRYGRFYGCSRYKRDSCRGGYNALDDGSPVRNQPRVGKGGRVKQEVRMQVDDWHRQQQRKEQPLPPTAWERIMADDGPAPVPCVHHGYNACLCGDEGEW